MRIDLWVLFTRPFWLDEWHTILVARRDSLTQVISDLYHGSDFGPPLTHIVAWIWRHAFGLSPVSLRVLSFSAALGAFAFLYFTLRRRFDVMPSLAGVLAIASHRLIISQSLEWRFYVAWLLFSAALAWSLSLDNDKPASRRRDVAIALSSIGLVTTHWFGVITLGLMSAAAFLSLSLSRSLSGGLTQAQTPTQTAFRRVLPVAAGLVALAIVLPLMFGQRGSIHEKSWIPDPTWLQFFAMLKMFLAAFVPAVAVLLILVALLLRDRGALRASALASLRDPAMLALLSGVAIPFILGVISQKQPALLERYAITLLFAWAPLIAFASHQFRRAPRALLLVWLSGLLVIRVARTASEHRNFAFSIAAGHNAIAEGCGRGIPVVFQVRHLMYPVTGADSVKGCDTRYLAISNQTLDAMYAPTSRQQRFFRIENEFSELHGRMYGFPRVVTEATLDSSSAFLLVGWEMSLPAGYKDIEKFRAAVFGGHRIVRITEDLTIFLRP
jgi:hypothetical protein